MDLGHFFAKNEQFWVTKLVSTIIKLVTESRESVNITILYLLLIHSRCHEMKMFLL